MVRQGDIIKLNLSPSLGHEQHGYRPAVVVSSDYVMTKTNMVYVAPITKTMRAYPLHVALDERTETSGDVLCEQVKAIDLDARGYTYVESMPDDILESVLTRIVGFFE
jgi:mRNA interferase MazF